MSTENKVEKQKQTNMDEILSALTKQVDVSRNLLGRLYELGDRFIQRGEEGGENTSKGVDKSNGILPRIKEQILFLESINESSTAAIQYLEEIV